MNKSIIFDWFTVFKFHDDFKLGKLRKFAKHFINNLIKSGWHVYVFKPNIIYVDPYILRQKIHYAGIHVFEVLYGVHSLERVPFKRGVYVDMAYFYLVGAFWPWLWVKCLRALKRIQ